MDYDGFDAEYGRVLEAAASLDQTSLAIEVERLRALVQAVQPVGSRRPHPRPERVPLDPAGVTPEHHHPRHRPVMTAPGTVAKRSRIRRS
jgi:hypothetical protein